VLKLGIIGSSSSSSGQVRDEAAEEILGMGTYIEVSKCRQKFLTKLINFIPRFKSSFKSFKNCRQKFQNVDKSFKSFKNVVKT
jgi:hypothetical protein